MLRMKNVIFVICICLVVSSAKCLDLKDLPDDSAGKAKLIMEHIDDLWRGECSRATMVMEVQTEHWKRSMSMEAWSKGKDYSLVRILTPKKDAGTTTLKYETDIFNYLPKTDRTVKITSGMMMGSWMGSHFTNDDLVKESRLSEDYTFKVVFDGKKDGIQLWEIELMPKPDSPVVWGKILFQIQQTDFLPIQAEYFDEDLELMRTTYFSDYKTFGSRILPAVMKLIPKDEPDEYTKLIYEKIDFQVKLENRFFSVRNLKSKN